MKRKFWPFFYGLVVLAGFGAGLYAWKGGKLPFLAPSERKVALKPGTPVDVLLLEPVSSGGTEKGAKVAALVADDIRDDQGGLLVKAGAPALLEVTRSRGSTAATEMINQPARLTLKFLKVQAADGQEVALTAKAGDPEEELEVTREVTSQSGLSDAATKLWNHPETQNSLKAIHDKLTGENPSAELKAPDFRKALEDVAGDMRMGDTAKALKDEKTWGALSDAAQKIGKGDLSGLGSGEAMIALGALKELGKLAGTVDDTIRGVFKGRNIVAPVGCRLRAYTAEQAVVQVKPEETPKG